MVKVSVALAAKVMNKGQQFVRVALQRNLVKFGFAVKLDENGSRYDYFINTKEFCDYMGITEKELEEYAKADKKRQDIILPEPLF